MKWTVILTREDEPNPENTYAAQCLELPGAISCGEGIQHTIEMIKECISLHLEGLIEDGESIPTQETVFDVSQLDEPPDYIVIVDVPIPVLVSV